MKTSWLGFKISTTVYLICINVLWTFYVMCCFFSCSVKMFFRFKNYCKHIKQSFMIIPRNEILIGLFLLVLFHSALLICVFNKFVPPVNICVCCILASWSMTSCMPFYVCLFIWTHSGDVNLVCTFTWVLNCGCNLLLFFPLFRSFPRQLSL